MPAVLLAEPEPTARTFLERHLIDNGFAVLSKPEEGRPHLVLAGDLEAVDAWGGEVPVIILSFVPSAYVLDTASNVRLAIAPPFQRNVMFGP